MFKNLLNCNCCKKKNFFQILKIKNQSIHTANNSPIKNNKKNKKFINLTLLFCKNCKNIQLREAVNPKILYENFNYETSITFGLTEHLSKLAKHLIKKFKITKQDNVLDIGSNDGSFLKEFKKNKIGILGIDPAKKIAKLACSRGINTLAKYFNCKLSLFIKKKYKNFKIITSFNTFANLYEFDDFLKGVKKLLSKDGVFIIETQYALDVIEKNLIDTVYHEHINYFSLSSLAELFERNGLKIYDFQRLSNKGGSVRIYSAKTNKLKTLKLKRGFLNEYKKLNLNKIKKFRKSLQNIRSNLKKNIKKIKKKRKCLSGFGSSVGSTTLVNFFQLQNHLSMIYDDNPLVQNLQFLKKNIPVEKSNKMKMNSYILILAWRYSRNIIKKHIDKKIKFINFLPKFKIN